MPSAADEISAAIAAAGGAIPFSEYMRLALYGEGGFYTTGGRAGRRGGDFITSPEVGPLFGTVIARALDAWWKELAVGLRRTGSRNNYRRALGAFSKNHNDRCNANGHRRTVTA